MHIQHVEAVRHNQDQKYVQTKLTWMCNKGHARQDHPLDNKTNQNQAVEIPANACAPQSPTNVDPSRNNVCG